MGRRFVVTVGLGKSKKLVDPGSLLPMPTAVLGTAPVLPARPGLQCLTLCEHSLHGPAGE